MQDDKTFKYYRAFKDLVYFIIRPLPIIYAVTISLYYIISYFAKKDFTQEASLLVSGKVLSIWIGAVTAILVCDDYQKRATFALSKKFSYFWSIVTPIFWLIFTNFLWFISLPIYIMYRTRLR